jgi:hypothetical protein
MLKNKQFLIIVVLLLVSILYFSLKEGQVLQPDGVLVLDNPMQDKINIITLLDNDDYTITAIASYDIKARVLSKKSYDDDIVPEDLALGWRNMSSNELLDTLTITQSDRFYFWHANQDNFPRHDIETQSANTHLVYRDKSIAKKIKEIKIGNVVHITGYLVNIKDKKKFLYWNTSLTRDDIGKGACELLYITDIKIIL